MSTDYNLKCKACNVSVETVASGSISYGDKLWRDTNALDRLSNFLFAHQGHDLVFDDSQRLDDGEDDDDA